MKLVILDVPLKNIDNSVGDVSIMKLCGVCQQEKSIVEFHKAPNHVDGRFRLCKMCQHKRGRAYARNRHLDHRFRLFEGSKVRAKNSNMAHSITLTDIDSPTHCKYLGVEIDYTPPSKRGGTRKWNGPSLDRIDNNLGYIPGNIQIISELANRMKQEASIEQLVSFARNVIAVHGHDYPPPTGVTGNATVVAANG